VLLREVKTYWGKAWAKPRFKISQSIKIPRCLPSTWSTLIFMPSNTPIFAGAHEINAAHSTFNAAGGDIIHNTTNINSSTDEILASLKPVERTAHTGRCMPGTRQEVLKKINDWLDDFIDDSEVWSLQ
jgi:hypothetical protein